MLKERRHIGICRYMQKSKKIYCFYRKSNDFCDKISFRFLYKFYNILGKYNIIMAKSKLFIFNIIFK